MKSFLSKLLFLVLFLYAGHAYALTSGTTTAGSIPSGGGISHQSFSGSSGQYVMLYADSSIAVTITVYRPGGTVWATGGNRVEAALDATGTFDVQVKAADHVSSGSYNLAYLRGADSVSNGALTSGQSYNGSLAVNGIESFTFSATTGQGVLFYVNSSYTPQIKVLTPTGALVQSVSANRLAINSLPSTGT